MRGLILLALMGIALLSGVNHAEAYDRVGYRYKVRYSDFDRGFYRTYGYAETCYTEYRYASTRTTCYDVAPYDYVYVQEQTYYDSYGRRYTRVTVYRDQSGYYPVAYYNVYRDNSYRSYVVYREYYSSSHYYYTSYRTYYHTSYTTVWTVNLNWDNWETKVFVGAYTSLLGLDLLVNSNSDLGTAVGAALFIVGKAKKAEGYKQRASELQKGIAEAQKDGSANALENLN